MFEKTIERDFKNYCLENNVLCLKLVVVGDNGYPDRMVLGHGFIFFVEFKRPGCYPSSLQKHTHVKLRFLGQKVFCFNSLKEAKTCLDLYMSGIVPLYKTKDNGLTSRHYGTLSELTIATY